MYKHNVVHVNQKAIACLRNIAITFIPITEILIMPQTTTTVTSCVKPVEELRSVEISFEDHEFYAGQKLIASITHNDDLTQPWIVMVNGEEIHHANTFKRCHSYITWHYQRGTLPIQEEETFKRCHSYITWHYQRGTLPIQEEETPVATTGNEIMVQIADECEKYGFEILNDGIYDHDQKLGEVSCSDSRWWVFRQLQCISKRFRVILHLMRCGYCRW
ncbi:hypothetical protein [Nostoc sp.]|uniref:hypothetical protein n=1 Tax=Nostoc sp. TaxID=1180 RepID=UPI002FFA0A47